MSISKEALLQAAATIAAGKYCAQTALVVANPALAAGFKQSHERLIVDSMRDVLAAIELLNIDTHPSVREHWQKK